METLGPTSWKLTRYGGGRSLAAALLFAFPPAERLGTAAAGGGIPTGGECVVGRHPAQSFIRFEGPVDHYRSRLAVTRGGEVVQILHPRLDAPPVLFGTAPALEPGEYELRWTVTSLTVATSPRDRAFRGTAGSRMTREVGMRRLILDGAPAFRRMRDGSQYRQHVDGFVGRTPSSLCGVGRAGSLRPSAGRRPGRELPLERGGRPRLRRHGCETTFILDRPASCGRAPSGAAPAT